MQWLIKLIDKMLAKRGAVKAPLGEIEATKKLYERLAREQQSKEEEK